MSTWITQWQAAEILGVHKSRVAKLVAQGKLSSRGRFAKGSLDRAEVLDLARERAKPRPVLPTPPSEPSNYHRPPDEGHEWLSVGQAASLLGVSSVAIGNRCQKGRLPHVRLGRRVWIRRDLLELNERARQAMRSRS